MGTQLRSKPSICKSVIQNVFLRLGCYFGPYPHHNRSSFIRSHDSGRNFSFMLSTRHYCMIDYNSTKPCQQQIDNCFEACSPQELLCMGTYSACNNQHNHDLQACAGDTHCIAEAKQAYWNCRAEAMLSVYCTNLHDWCYNQFHCIIPCQKESDGCKFYFADCREEVRVMEMC